MSKAKSKEKQLPPTKIMQQRATGKETSDGMAGVTHLPFSAGSSSPHQTPSKRRRGGAGVVLMTPPTIPRPATAAKVATPRTLASRQLFQGNPEHVPAAENQLHVEEMKAQDSIDDSMYMKEKPPDGAAGDGEHC